MRIKNIDELKQEFKTNLKEDIRIVLNLMEINIKYNSPSQNLIIGLIARLKDLTDNASKGLISFNVVTEEKNKIREAVLNLIDNIKEEDLLKEDETQLIISKLRYDNRTLKKENEELKKEVRKLENQKGILHFEKLKDLEGYWLEIISEHKENNRLFSIGRFCFNEVKNEFEFNGKNYKNNGTPYYEWNTLNLIPDVRANKFYLFYTTSPLGQAQSESIGSAVIHYTTIKKQQWKIDKGYFMDVSDKKIPKNFFCFKIEEIAQKLNFNLNMENELNHSEFIKTLFNNKENIDMLKAYL